MPKQESGGAQNPASECVSSSGVSVTKTKAKSEGKWKLEKTASVTRVVTYL